MITAFSRGGAAAAIFSQMLYEKGLVTADGQVLIPPGTAGAVSNALIIDPVDTGETGNMNFIPHAQNVTVVQAQNEYRQLFRAEPYTGDNVTILPVTGNHGDAGDLYDSGLGGMYLQAYTSYFKNAGLNIAAIDPTRAYVAGNPVVVHSESVASKGQILPLPLWDLQTDNSLPLTNINYLTAVRQTNPHGSLDTGNGFTAYDGSIVLSGTDTSNHGGSVTTGIQQFYVAPGATATITSYGDAIVVDSGGTLVFYSTSQGTGNTMQGRPSSVTLETNATLDLFGPDVSIFGNNATIFLQSTSLYNTLSGQNDSITLAPGASISTASGASFATDDFTFDIAGGKSFDLKAGTFAGGGTITNPGNGTIQATITTPVGYSFGMSALATGTFTVNTATDAGSFALTDGLTLTLPAINNNVISAPVSTATPEQALLGYLSNLGKPLTASALDALNYAYLNPTGTAYTVTPVITAGSAAAAAARRVRVLRSGTGMTYMLESVAVKPATSPSTATFTLNNAAPGAVVTGIAGDTNVLQATNVDLARDTITGVATLKASGSVSMTGGQFTAFTGINGVSALDGSAAGQLTLTTAGSYALSGSDVGVKSFAAQDWGGTTLTGNATAGQALYASLYGNDTLKAGSGAGDVLVAGEGVDTLTGNAAGGDAFIATGGLAGGSKVTGTGAGNTLQFNQGDLTVCTVTVIATLLTANATLTAAQFGGFTQITDYLFAHQGQLFAATGGAYDLSAKVTGTGDYFNMTALSNAGNTIKGQSPYNGTLTTSALGNDSLSNAGRAANDNLFKRCKIIKAA